ncbi:MAG TPA: dTDP-4-dehydrorhamnose 3,5-epimerase [Candidatus Paceibacterota bacterium]|nr:dTDP-4-dehydrorhamnose 3,5-epimerase [Candidatus Paceibacterota bacterium]
MNIETTGIRDVYILTPNVHEDERGFFMETYRKDVLAAAGIMDDFVQHNHSRTVRKNTVRGLHFQWGPPMAKLIRVTRGAAFLVAVDIRLGSPTLGKWVGVEASEDNKKQLYAPGGFARGLQTLSDTCEIQYPCSTYYDATKEGQIRWDDPDVGIDWPIKDAPVLSDKDRNAPTLKEWLARAEAAFFRFDT